MNKKTKYLHILFAFVNAQKIEVRFGFIFSNRVPDCLGSKKWIKTDLLSVIRRRCWDFLFEGIRQHNE